MCIMGLYVIVPTHICTHGDFPSPISATALMPACSVPILSPWQPTSAQGKTSQPNSKGAMLAT